MSVGLIIMICECIVATSLLVIAIVLTIDVFKRISTLKLIDMQLDELIKLIIKIHKREKELEQLAFKINLINETQKEKRKEEYKAKVMGIFNTGDDGKWDR